MSEFKRHFLKDYASLSFAMDQADLAVCIQPKYAEITLLTSVQKLKEKEKHCFLNGKNITLKSIEINGKKLKNDQFQVEKEGLWLYNVKNNFSLKIIQHIDYSNNKTLEGLYQSERMLCTHCEPDGFSRISFFIDRPDHLSTFRATLIAPKKQYPVLLCNGNCIEQKDLKNGFHQATFFDPFKKPAYLFAMVFGELECMQDTFESQTGKTIKLKLYRQAKKDLSQLKYALESLKKAMEFDEKTFGLSYELDQYSIVAIDNFNSGAMENKGLNLFNTRYLLAHPSLATDTDYFNIRAVVGHEYFHNWTGNRVTCRDWFQLSLKEGLTVFREQLFMEKQANPTLTRIDQVELLRTHQFIEDQGPLAHPVRPESYIEVDNFYTTTVYEKGAEIIRMIKLSIGDKAFFAGITDYLKKHDGKAAIIEDLITAFSQASQTDLSQFLNWYTQVGTPSIEITSTFVSNAQEFQIQVEQKNWDQRNQTKPLWIPIQISLLQKNAKCFELVNHQPNVRLINSYQAVLQLKLKKETFVFKSIDQSPLLSYLQSFSAPVHAIYAQDEEQQNTRILHDIDDFSRYEQLQAYYRKHLASMINQDAQVPLEFESMLSALFEKFDQNPGLLARFLHLPSTEELQLCASIKNIQKILDAKVHWKQHIAKQLEALFYEKYLQAETQAFTEAYVDAEYRLLRGEILSYLVHTQSKSGKEQAIFQYTYSSNLTEKLSALNALISIEYASKTPSAILDDLLENFYQKAQNEPLLINQYFRLQASRLNQSSFKNIIFLVSHSKFDQTNPNCVYALLGRWVSNLYAFHHLSEEAKHQLWLAEKIIKLDQLNPSVASRLLIQAFSNQNAQEKKIQLYIQQALEKLSQQKLSKNTYEAFMQIYK